MRIERDCYLDKLRSRMWNGMVKVVTGIRRCGKSYLLFDLFKEYLMNTGVDPKDIVEIKLDMMESVGLRDPIKLYEFLSERCKNGKKYVFIDEIQLIPSVPNPYLDNGDKITFYDVLNSLLRMDNVDVYVTGSNSKMLSTDILTEFRGRGDEIRIHPLSFSEYYSAVGGDRIDAYNNFIKYGGMPRTLSIDNPESKKSYLKNLFDETYLRDIRERYSIDRLDALDGIIDALCSSVGSLTNPRNIANSVSGMISENTARNYLSYVVDAFLFTESKRYNVKGRKYYSYPVKYYCEDLGLRNAHLNFRQLENTHLMENAIFNELIIRGFDVDVGVVTVNTHDDSGKSIRIAKEIDFVANKGDVRIYIQSAFTLTEEEKERKELDPFKRVNDSFKKMVVRSDVGIRWLDDDGFLHINIIDFLLDKNVTEY